MGSATLKYIRPIPIPAAKSMDTQEKNEYWGLLSLLPNLMSPYLLNMRYTRKMTKMVTAQTYTQLRLMKIKDLTVLSRSSVSNGKAADSKHMPRMKIKLGSVTPLLRVVLIFGNLIITCIETKTEMGCFCFRRRLFSFEIGVK